MINLKITLLTAHPIWTQALSLILAKFTQASNVTSVIIEDSLSTDFTIVKAVAADVIIISTANISDDLNCARMLRTTDCEVPIIIICFRLELPCFEELAEIGIAGIVSSSIKLEELEAAIYAVAEKQPDTLQQQYKRATQLLHCPAPQAGLSQREIEILQLVAAGRANEKIAVCLQLSPKTVSNHLERIYHKLEVKGRMEAVMVALDKRALNFRTIMSLINSSK